MADSKKQIDKFKEAAREVGTDNDEKRFEDRLRRVATTAPSKPIKKPTKKKK